MAFTGNGYAIAIQEICLADDGGVATKQRYRPPAGLVSADSLLEIRIKTPDAIYQIYNDCLCQKANPEHDVGIGGRDASAIRLRLQRLLLSFVRYAELGVKRVT